MSRIPLKFNKFGFAYPSSKKRVVQNIDLEIGENERVLLLGASGSGKSTLALAASGLIPHYVNGFMDGDVEIFGTSTTSTQYGEIVRKVGIMFQDPEISFATLRVRHEVAFALENFGVPQYEIDQRVMNALRFVELDDKADTPLEFLSGGEKQRVELAALIAQSPSFMVMDEPSSMLDPVATLKLFKLIAQLESQSMLIIEHKLDELINFVDRVVILGNNGSIIADGKPSDVFNSYFDDIEAQGVWMPRTVAIAKILEKYGLVRFDQLPLEVSGLVRQIGESQIFDQIDLKDISMAYQPKKGGLSPLFTLDEVSYVYSNGFEALKDVNLEIPEGKTVAIVGKNGAGKTTLIDILAGLKKPTTGQVLFDGKIISEMSDDELYSRIGYVFQNPEHQFLRFTVWDELAYSLKMQGFSDEVVHNRVSEMLPLLRLNGMESRNPFTLSQGEKRRLSLGSMLILEQDVLILDEPTYGQDRHSALGLLQLATKFRRKSATMLVVTHDIDLAFEEADEIVVMHKGGVIWNGTPEQLLKHQDIMKLAGLTVPVAARISIELSKRYEGFPMLYNLKMWRKFAHLVKEKLAQSKRT